MYWCLSHRFALQNTGRLFYNKLSRNFKEISDNILTFVVHQEETVGRYSAYCPQLSLLLKKRKGFRRKCVPPTDGLGKYKSMHTYVHSVLTGMGQAECTL